MHHFVDKHNVALLTYGQYATTHNGVNIKGLLMQTIDHALPPYWHCCAPQFEYHANTDLFSIPVIDIVMSSTRMYKLMCKILLVNDDCVAPNTFLTLNDLVF